MPSIHKRNSIDINLLSESLKQSLYEVMLRLQSNRYSTLYTECDNEKIQAAALSWNNSFHPFANYIHFTEESSNTLINNLLAVLPAKHYTVFNCYENETEKQEMVEKLGFKLFRKTYMETYDIKALLDKLDSVPSLQSFISLDEIQTNPVLEESLYKLVKRNYTETHLHNPEKETTWQEWKEIIEEDQADTQNSIVTPRNKNVESYIFLHCINDTHYEVGLMGHVRNENMYPLLKQALLQLHKNGVKTVEFEIDTTNFLTWQFSNLLHFDDKISFNAYIRNENEVEA